MANNYVIGSAKSYPSKHNNRENKLIETVRDDAKAKGSVSAALAADFALTDTDGLESFIVNDAIAITLPAASTNSGRVLRFVQKGTAVLTITQNADGANIAGADSNYVALDAAGDWAELICDGTEWHLGANSIA